jgi:hypothetical protein
MPLREHRRPPEQDAIRTKKPAIRAGDKNADEQQHSACEQHVETGPLAEEADKGIVTAYEKTGSSSK